jgi:lysophospholipase L1-like esterase
VTRGRRAATRRLVGLLLIVVTLALVAVVVLRLQGPGNSVAEVPLTAATAGPRTPTAPATGSPGPGTGPSVRPTGPVRLVGFGDSVMFGAGCDCEDFLAQTADLLQRRTGRVVDTVNNSANGETAGDLLGDLRTDEAYAAEIRRADVIVLTIGANDLGPALDDWVGDACEPSCYHPEVAAMGDRLSAILTIVDREKQAHAPVLVLNYWNVFEDGAVGAEDHDGGYLDWSDRVTRDANTAICRAAVLAAGTCVDLYQPFKGADGTQDPTSLLADDGDHPNAAGTALIATVLAAAVERRGSLG